MFDKKDILDKKLKIETEFSKEINKIIKNYDSYSFKQKQAVNQSLNTLLVNISNLINSTAYQEPFTFYESQCESEKDIRDFEIYRRWNARSECSRLNIYPSLLVIGGSKIGYNEALYAALS